MSDTDDSTSTVAMAIAMAIEMTNHSPFLEFCAKVRNNDRSILPTPGEAFKFPQLERE
jgi:hypothetical protein